RRLARTGRTDNSHCLPRLDLEGHVIDALARVRELKGDIVENDVTFNVGEIRNVLRFLTVSSSIFHLEEFFELGACGDSLIDEGANLIETADHQLRKTDKGNHIADAHLALSDEIGAENQNNHH